MKKTFKKMIFGMLLVLCIGCFAGCGSSTQTSEKGSVKVQVQKFKGIETQKADEGKKCMGKIMWKVENNEWNNAGL